MKNYSLMTLIALSAMLTSCASKNTMLVGNPLVHNMISFDIKKVSSNKVTMVAYGSASVFGAINQPRLKQAYLDRANKLCHGHVADSQLHFEQFQYTHNQMYSNFVVVPLTEQSFKAVGEVTCRSVVTQSDIDD